MNQGEAIKLVAKGLAHVEYSLLLGAGSSLGGLGGNGAPLPTGAGLCQELIDEFGVDTGGESISLARAFEQIRRGRPQELREYLYSRFFNCAPSWQAVLTNQNWQRIWTLNIDDVLERCCERTGREFASFGWRDRLSTRGIAYKQQIVHLHGRASDLAPDAAMGLQGLVFTLGDYVRTISDPQSWHRAFFDEFADHPFLIIGARLVEEFDLKEAISQGSIAERTTGYPTILVVPSATKFQREELASHNIEVIECTGEEFALELQTAHRSELAELEDVYGRVVPADIARFLRNFIDLRSYSPSTNDEFYLGYTPTWANILGEDDAPLDVTKMAANDLIATAKADDIVQRICLLTGAAGTGKSTGLLRTARHVAGAGLRPFLFRADEAFDVESVRRWIQTVPDTVLVFDDCADFAHEIGHLIRRCVESNVKLIAIGVERASRLSTVEDAIPQEYLLGVSAYHYGRLSDQDIVFLIEKLESRGRLGDITRLSRADQIAYFRRTADSRIFDGMAGLEGGSGFVSKVRRTFEELSDERLRVVYRVAALAFKFGIGLPVSIAASLAGLPVAQFVLLILSDASDAMVVDRNGVRLSHRVTAAIVIDRTMTQGERFDTSLTLAKSLAPLVDPNAIRTLTRPYRIIRVLMTQKEVVNHVGLSRAREWYSSLQSEYDWNGRYWEQRALLESSLGDQSAARSYAERALQVHPHAFAYNTLGTILLRDSIDTGDLRLLERGIAELERARDYAMWEPSEHPYVTFFSSLIRFAERWGIDSISPSVRAQWSHWFYRASTEPLFNHRSRTHELQEYQRSWLMFATRE